MVTEGSVQSLRPFATKFSAAAPQDSARAGFAEGWKAKTSRQSGRKSIRLGAPAASQPIGQQHRSTRGLGWAAQRDEIPLCARPARALLTMLRGTSAKQAQFTRAALVSSTLVERRRGCSGKSTPCILRLASCSPSRSQRARLIDFHALIHLVPWQTLDSSFSSPWQRWP